MTIKAVRTGPSGNTPYGYAREGLIYDVPEGAAGFEAVSATQRFTEPAGKLPAADTPPELTNAQLKEQLDALGVKYAANANKAVLTELLAEAEAPKGEQTDGEAGEPDQDDGNAEG